MTIFHGGFLDILHVQTKYGECLEYYVEYF